ncbi:hypothetical protein ACL02T_29715 [Pseudonocardia sp. RS010]|uniref:hypothetical protein n=1 Tax=Pseudonocardia sp. RS010 TaxID=3385979 RepID=UPI00399F567A
MAGIVTTSLLVPQVAASAAPAVEEKAASATPQPNPPAKPRPTVAPDSAKTTGGLVLQNTGSPEEGAASRAALCNFTTNGDYVHVSSGDASGHGWWVNGDCDTEYATVTVTLQEYFADGTWHDISEGEATVLSGGGRGKRATARATCEDTSFMASWRTVVDVDLVGIIDDSTTLTTDYQDLPCAVYD